MTSQTTANTGALIQQTVSQLLVKPLEAASVVLSAGPTILDTNGPLTVPRLVSGVSAGFIAESAPITEGNATFDTISLLPSTLQGVKTIVRLSAESIRSSTQGLSQVIQSRLVTDVATALDQQFVSGTGTNKPKGILSQTGISTSATLDLTEPNTLLAAMATAASNNVVPTHWFINPTDWFALVELKDTTHRYLIEPDAQAAAAARLFGLPVVVTPRIASGTVLLVDIQQVLIARDISPSVEILTETYAATDEIGVKVTARFDIGLAHPLAATVLTTAA
jgi:HK97 family phage major capsid protein